MKLSRFWIYWWDSQTNLWAKGGDEVCNSLTAWVFRNEYLQSWDLWACIIRFVNLKISCHLTYSEKEREQDWIWKVIGTLLTGLQFILKTPLEVEMNMKKKLEAILYLVEWKHYEDFTCAVVKDICLSQCAWPYHLHYVWMWQLPGHFHFLVT